MSEKLLTKVGPADLKEGEFRGYALGKRNLFVANVKGSFCAMDDWCNHAGCLLSSGWIEKNQIVCPCHEIGFDLKSGKNETSPGIADDQKTFETVVQSGELFVVNFP
jgi:3-phenylpropionate/trans-cinnamate dioxygenase ferredoxin component